MGMAASQVRFLSLQNRKNTIGLNLMTLSNRKSALSRDMNRVAAQYNEAMNQRNLKWSSDCGISYKDLSYDLLMKPNETNSLLPYIVTDAQGRVVLDDNNIMVDGLDSGISYRQLATMISSYSGTDKKTGETYYNNTSYVSGIENNAVTKDANKNITGVTRTGTSGLPTQGGNEYKIVTTLEGYGFQNSMRYDLMKQLGLITKHEQDTFNTVLNELYGNEAVFDKNNYEAILRSFDESKTKASEDLNGTSYSDIFGSLQRNDSDGNIGFKLNGGCAMGNLALAKAYQKEYQAYLNTEFKHDLFVDKKETLLTTTKNSFAEIDATNSTPDSDFIYNEYANTGVSTRMIALLEQSGEVTKVGNNYQLNLANILQYTDGTVFNDDGYEHALFWAHNGDVKGNIQTLLDLYDNPSTSLDTKGIDGTTGSDGYISGSEIDRYDGYALGFTKHLDNGNRVQKLYEDANNPLDKFLNSLVESFTTVPDVNIDGLNWAKEKTKELFKNGSISEESDGSPKSGRAKRRAKNEAFDNRAFGYGWCNHQGSNSDYAFFNTQAAINAFVTFYEMYMAVDGNTDYIVGANGGTEVYKSEVLEPYGEYNADVAEKLANGNPMNDLFSEWKSQYASENNVTTTEVKIEGSTPQASATEQTIRYSYKATETDPEDGSTSTTIEYADVTGIWNGSQFTSISNLKFSYKTDSQPEYKDVEYKYESNTTGGKIIQTSYDLTESSDGTTITGNPKYAVVTYNYNRNSGQTNASVVLEQATPNQVKTINIADNSIVSILNTSSNDISNNSNLKENGFVYYIATEEGGETPDDRYKYRLEAKSINNSVFASTMNCKPQDVYGEAIANLVADCEAKVNELQNNLKNTFASLERKGMDYFDALFTMISRNGWVYDESVNTDKKEESRNYLNAMLENNMYFVTEVDTLDGTDFNYATKIAQNCSSIFQVYDEAEQNIALSEYESKKAEITSKEKQLDIRMNKLEAEQDAISTELQSLKKIIDDNVSNTFKIFT